MSETTIYALAVATALVAACLRPLVGGNADVGHVLAAVTAAIGAYPMWRYLADRNEAVPAFPFIAALYGVFFGGSVLLIDEPYFRLEHISRDALITAQALSLFGLLILVGVYYGYLPAIRVRSTPGRPAIMSGAVTVHAAIIAGFIGLCAELAHRLLPVPLGLRAITVALSQLVLLSVGVLFYMQLRRNLSWPMRALLWVAVVGLLTLRLASGFQYPLIELGAVLALVYIGARQRVPWLPIVIGVALLFPLLAFKAEYRALAWSGSRAEVATLEDVAEKASLFADIAVSTLAAADWTDLEEAVTTVARRGDHTYEFAHYMVETPATVPYMAGETYADFFWKFVPRLLAPDKPQSVWGNELGHRYGLLAPSDDLTSVNVPQMIEMYMNFGVPGVLIGMYLMGQLYRLLLKRRNRVGASEWLVASLAVVSANLLNIESDFLLVFGGIPYLLLLLYITPRILGWFLAQPRSTNLSRETAGGVAHASVHSGP